MYLVAVVNVLIGRVILLFLLFIVIRNHRMAGVDVFIGIDLVKGRAALTVVRVPHLLVVLFEECIPGALLSLEVLKPRALDDLRSLLGSHW